MAMEGALKVIRLIADAAILPEINQEPACACRWVYRQMLISPDPGSLAGNTATNGAVVEKLTA